MVAGWIVSCLGIALVTLMVTPSLQAAAPKTLADLPYKEGDSLSDYEKERCNLDLYLPDAKGFATIVFFHGGGLTGGSKFDVNGVAKSFAAAGIAVAAPNYRFSPQVKFPAYVEDAAASVAWVHKHIAEHGGNPKRIYVGGHSAGGYLAMMVGFDEQYLEPHGLKLDAIAGLINISGQLFTHSTIRGERGIANARGVPTIDEAAPAFHARADAPPVLMLFADDDMPMRAEETRYFAALLKYVKHPKVAVAEIPKRTHVSVGTQIANAKDPGRELILKLIEGK